MQRGQAGTRRPSTLGLAVAGVAGLVFGSCGGGGGNGGPIPFAELEARVLEAACHASVTCESMPDEETCLAALHAVRAYYPTLSEDIGAGTIKYDGAAAGRCIDRLRNAGCSRLVEAQASAAADPDCGAALVGAIPAGGACFFKDECADHVSCTKSDAACTAACCPGTCEPARIPTGGDCSTGARCTNEATCVLMSAGVATCVALPRTAGADCSLTKICASPFACVSSSSSTPAMICKSPAATGAPCDDPLACDDARDICDLSTKVCRRRGAVGASCATGACVPYASCDNATKVCLARGKIGQPCVPSCLDGLSCDAATQLCVGPAPDAPACR